MPLEFGTTCFGSVTPTVWPLAGQCFRSIRIIAIITMRSRVRRGWDLRQIDCCRHLPLVPLSLPVSRGRVPREAAQVKVVLVGIGPRRDCGWN